jgi:hypothetical protein
MEGNLSRILRQALNPGEVALEGATEKEIEFDFYAILADWRELNKASGFEQQEQWVMGAPEPADGSKGFLRVRKTIQGRDGMPEYVFAIKNKTDKTETPQVTTVDVFTQFQRLSSEGQMKDRYFFPVPGTALKFEVDCFLLPEVQHLRRKGAWNRGVQYYPWVKIDLEIPPGENKATFKVPEFPFEVERVIMAPYGHRPADEEKIVSELYKKHYVALNPFAK